MTKSRIVPPTVEDETFMREALREAILSEARGEVPVGSVVVRDGKIIARAHNLRETAQDPTAHAELIAVRKAAARLATWRLTGTTVYVTLEPCPMCAGMLVNSRVDRVVWGATDPKAGALESVFRLGDDPRLNHTVRQTSGVLEAECAVLLRDFFAKLRSQRR